VFICFDSPIVLLKNNGLTKKNKKLMKNIFLRKYPTKKEIIRARKDLGMDLWNEVDLV
jgi:hypothetical protein